MLSAVPEMVERRRGGGASLLAGASILSQGIGDGEVRAALVRLEQAVAGLQPACGVHRALCVVQCVVRGAAGAW